MPGLVRGKKWSPPPPDAKQLDADEKIAIDLGDEYEQALTDASQEEIIDLAGKIKIKQKIYYITSKLNFHSILCSYTWFSLDDESRPIPCIIAQ